MPADSVVQAEVVSGGVGGGQGEGAVPKCEDEERGTRRE